MRRYWVFMSVMWWCGAVSGSEMTGERVLKRSADAYAALKSYVGTTTVKSKVQFADELLVQTASARITFVRPGKIRIEGKDTGGGAFVIISDGRSTWTSWVIKNRGAFQKAQSVEMAIAGMTGVAACVPTTIPGALMNLKWGCPFAWTKGSKCQGREKIGGADCYKVVSNRPIGKRTSWVDSRTFLLRQMREQQNEKQLADAQKHAQEAIRRIAKEKGLEIPEMMRMKSRETMESFAVERINGPVDEKLFRDPTKGKKR